MASREASQRDSALDQLQSEDQNELLNTIDTLRNLGLTAQLKLPQIIVCGDTSSGKSSVLEAISGVRFPADQLLCTQFASEVRLRREKRISFSVKIEPAEARTQKEQDYLNEFEAGTEFTDLQEFAGVVKKAVAHLSGIEGHGSFFKDVLVAEIHGPDLPPLTLVDLPGFIHSSRDENIDDISTVEGIVNSYMAQPSSIMLAVIDADNDLANQVVLQRVKAHESAIERTLGIMTKLDKFPSASPRGLQAIQCAKTGKNDFVTLRHGWHMLRNRDYEARNTSIQERNARELEFFSKDGWNNVPAHNRGASTLRDKLSDMLFKEIRGNLPTIVQDIKARISDCESQAERLGDTKSTDLQRTDQLHKVSGELHKLIDAATKGPYTTLRFFDQEPSEEISPRRLRACLRGYLKQFSSHMHDSGMRFSFAQDDQAVTVTELNFSSASDCFLERPDSISPRNLHESLKRHVELNAGIEISGRMPPSIYASVLSFQCSRWEDIAAQYAQGCWEIAKDCFTQALQATSPPHVAAGIGKYIVEKHFNRAETTVMEKVRELVKPYKNRTFFMLNQLELDWETDTLTDYGSVNGNSKTRNAGNEITQSTLGEVLDWVFGAYEIALNTFIDNFSSLAIEFCLVEDLPKLFTSRDINRMGSELIKKLTTEPDSIIELRSSNLRELNALQDALKICNIHSTGLSACNASASRPGSQAHSRSRHSERAPTRVGTADEITQQLQSLSVSPPSPARSPSSSAPGTARKAKPNALSADPNVVTPPRTPPSRYNSSDRLSQSANGRPRSALSAYSVNGKARLIQPEYGASPSRSRSPLSTSYREPTVDEPTSEEL